MAIEVLEKRYPSLAFLLTLEQNLPSPLFQIDKEKEALPPLDWDNLDVIYVYGIGQGVHYEWLKKWLSDNHERDLVFLEEHLIALKQFLKTTHAREVLSHSQVHIRLNLNWKNLSAFAEECTASFPVEKIAVIAHPTYKRSFRSRFYRLRLMLHRKATVSHALFHENRYYHHFIDHFLSNFCRIESSFDANRLKGMFKGVPAIICGAGPSLTNDIETIRKREDKALIFAGGSAIPALTHRGILPHFGIAYDPNEDEFDRFKEANGYEVPILYASRLNPSIFNTCNGPSGYLQSETGGCAEYWMEQHLNLAQSPLQQGLTLEALSVTTAALQIACTYGCDPVILVGVDLAFTNNQLYASGVLSGPIAPLEIRNKERCASEKLLMRRDERGAPILTAVKWVMEQSAILAFIKNNPQFTILNATSGGLGFKPLPYTPLHTICLKQAQDLRGKVHHAIQNARFTIPTGQVKALLFSLKESLDAAATCVSNALQELEIIKKEEKDPETGPLILAEIELEALEAYTAFLQPFDVAFPVLVERRYRPSPFRPISFLLKWKIAHFRWTSYRDLIQFYQEKILALLTENT